MNIASYNALAGALQNYGAMRRDREEREARDKQLAFQNRMSELAMALQRTRRDDDVAAAERTFNYRAGRDEKEDAFRLDQVNYGRMRDNLSDTRFDDQTAYTRGRDRVADMRHAQEFTQRGLRNQIEDNFRNMELGLRMQALKDRGSVGGYLTEELDEDGNVISTRRRVPVSRDGKPVYSSGATTPPAASVPAGPKNQQELLDAVRQGKMTKDQAKEFARQQGWN